MSLAYTVKSSFSRPVLPETLVLAAICIFDCALTVYLVKQGIAVEANPLLGWSFRFGIAGFVIAKLLWFLPPLFIIEALRPKIKNFARTALRAGIVGYMLIYIVGTLVLHPHLIR
jgi:hypothetical protein